MVKINTHDEISLLIKMEFISTPFKLLDSHTKCTYKLINPNPTSYSLVVVTPISVYIETITSQDQFVKKIPVTYRDNPIVLIIGLIRKLLDSDSHECILNESDGKLDLDVKGNVDGMPFIWCK